MIYILSAKPNATLQETTFEFHCTCGKQFHQIIRDEQWVRVGPGNIRITCPLCRTFYPISSLGAPPTAMLRIIDILPGNSFVYDIYVIECSCTSTKTFQVRSNLSRVQCPSCGTACNMKDIPIPTTTRHYGPQPNRPPNPQPQTGSFSSSSWNSSRPRAAKGCRIYWSPSDSLWAVHFPYDEHVKNQFKTICEGKARWWKEHGLWLIPDKYVDDVKKFLTATYGYVDFKPRVERRQTGIVATTSNGNPYQELFRLLGLEAMTKSYRAAMVNLHPDRGGDPTRAARLNELWTALKEELSNG